LNQETNGDQLLEEVSSTAKKTAEVQRRLKMLKQQRNPHKSSCQIQCQTHKTKTDLEVTVTELRERLKEAQQKESSQQQQITDLQSTLQEQKIDTATAVKAGSDKSTQISA